MNELKEFIDEDFGLLELATNAGRDVKQKDGKLYIVHSICNSEGQLVWLMAKVGSY